jgi:hypothetical protein
VKSIIVKCIDCKKIKSWGILEPPDYVKNGDPVPIYRCMEWPSPRDNQIMSKIELETPLECEFFEEAG